MCPPTVPRQERSSNGEWPQVPHLFCPWSLKPAEVASALRGASCLGRAAAVTLPDRTGFVLCGRRGPQCRGGTRGPRLHIQGAGVVANDDRSGLGTVAPALTPQCSLPATPPQAHPLFPDDKLHFSRSSKETLVTGRDPSSALRPQWLRSSHPSCATGWWGGSAEVEPRRYPEEKVTPVLREVEVCVCALGGGGVAMEPVASPETQSCLQGDSKESLKGHATGPPGKLVYCKSSFIQRVNLYSWQQVLSEAK